MKIKPLKGTAEEGWVNINVTVVEKKKNFAGVAPAVFKSAKSALKKISGGLAMGLPGSVPIVNVFV